MYSAQHIRTGAYNVNHILLTQHAVCFSTHGIIIDSDVSDLLLRKVAAAVFGDGGIIINRVHLRKRQPLREGNLLCGNLCEIEMKLILLKLYRQGSILCSTLL